MDEPRRSDYVRPVVNLLLLLSALLSALTGLSPSARVVEPAAISRTTTEVAPQSAAAVRAQARIEPGLPMLRAVAVFLPRTTSIVVAPVASLLTNRRRE